MRPTVPLLLALLLAANCSSPEPPPATAKPEPSPIEAFFSAPIVSDPSFFPDGNAILFTTTDLDGTNAWKVDWNGKARRITDCGGAACRALAALADGRVLIERSCLLENTHLQLLAPGGQPVELPGQKGTAGQFIGASPDGRRFYTGGNGRDEHAFDLYEWKVEELKPRLIFQNDVATPWFIGPVSPDGSRVALVRSRGAGGDELRIRELRSGRDTKIPTAPRDLIEPLFFREAELYYLACHSGDFRVLMRAGPGGQPEIFLRPQKNFMEFRGLSIAPDGSQRVTIESREGFDLIGFIADDGGNRPLLQPQRGHVGWAKFSPDSARLVYTLGGDTAPEAIYLWTSGGQTVKLFGGRTGVDPDNLIAAMTARHIPARDRAGLKGLVYLPERDPGRRLPAVIWLHGGPGDEARREYSPFIQYLASRGYVALALNFRGSNGYGRKFLDADNRRHGLEPVDDVIDARDWLAAKDFVDPRRIAVVGRSYGGYLALAALARAPAKFAAGVDLFGPSNWVTALESLPPEARVHRPALFAEFGDPAADRDRLLAISPVSFADRLRGPLLIVQGGIDSRVARVDTEELVRRIRAAGGQVEYVFFMTEGHGFSRTINEIRCWSRVGEFLDLHLRGIKPPSAVPPASARPPVFAQ